MRCFVFNGWAASQDAWSLCDFKRDRIFSYVEQLDGEPEKALADLDENERVILVGWSMGGSSALRIAMAQPRRIAGLVLVATTPRMMKDDGWAGMTERRLAALDAGLRLTMGGGFFGIPEGRPNPYILDDEASLARGLDYLKTTDLRESLLAMRKDFAHIPVEIFQSERDGIVRPENAQFLLRVFPHAKLHMIPGAEHALPVTIPQQIDAALQDLAA